MRSEFRWATATKGSERERLLASDLSEVRGPRLNGTPTPSYNHPPASIAADATPTRPGNIGLSRELRCRFLRTALAQRITLCSELITFPGPVTVTARSALAFSTGCLTTMSNHYLDYRLLKLLLSRFQPVSIERSWPNAWRDLTRPSHSQSRITRMRAGQTALGHSVSSTRSVCG